LSIVAETEHGATEFQSIRAEAPLEKNPDYEVFPTPQLVANECRDYVMSTMRIEDRWGAYVDAWFERVKCPNLPNCPGSIPPEKLFEINVYWPDSATLHHAGRGQSINCSSINCEHLMNCLPECQMYAYATISTASGTELNWRHVGFQTLPSFYHLISFDNVLYANQCGKAECGAPPHAGDCADDPTIKWKVYHPGWLCY